MSALPRALTAIAAAGLVLATGAGCTGTTTVDYDRQAMAVDLANALRQEALKVPDDDQREKLVSGIIQLRELLIPETILKPGPEPPAAPQLPKPEGGNAPAPPWAIMFAPKNLVVGFFTRSKNFDTIPGDDGLEVRLQPLDQFGDPTKAIGSYRIEIFEYRLHSGEKRGKVLGHWFVKVLDEKSNRLYYDPVDRSYVFPLMWDAGIPPGTPVIVQATYYPPGGFEEKLFAQRVIKIGPE